jgi:hypothetical protein
MSTTAVNEKTARIALLRELRNSKVNLRRANESLTPRKKRRAQCDQIEILGDRKIPRNTQAVEDGTVSTFLKLSPPSLSAENAPLTFTFGRRHYKSISLAGLAKTSCGCASVNPQFDIFSCYRCPCKKQKNSSIKQRCHSLIATTTATTISIM